MKLEKPESPWFINVSHYRYGGRPYCQSPVDYNLAVLLDDIDKVNCSLCVLYYHSVFKEQE
jgi:hypothetical protein